MQLESQDLNSSEGPGLGRQPLQGGNNLSCESGSDCKHR